MRCDRFECLGGRLDRGRGFVGDSVGGVGPEDDRPGLDAGDRIDYGFRAGGVRDKDLRGVETIRLRYLRGVDRGGQTVRSPLHSLGSLPEVDIEGILLDVLVILKQIQVSHPQYLGRCRGLIGGKGLYGRSLLLAFVFRFIHVELF